MRTVAILLLSAFVLSSMTSGPVSAQTDRVISPRILELRTQSEDSSSAAVFRDEPRQAVNCAVGAWFTSGGRVRVLCDNARLFVDFAPEFFHADHPVCGAIAVAEPNPRACSEFYQAEIHAFITYVERRVAAGQNIEVAYRRVEGATLFHPIVRYGYNLTASD